MNSALRIHRITLPQGVESAMRGFSRRTLGVLAAAVLATACLADCGRPSAAPERGAQVYAAHCAVCHGKQGEGGSAPELMGEHYHKDEQQIVLWIKNALPPMPRLYPATLSDQDVKDVASFVASL
jgi:mono/diheme cytochrome c family protein